MSKELVSQKTGEITSGGGLDINAGSELQIAPAVAQVMAEVQASMLIAQQRPRQFEVCWGKLMESCKRETLARVASYSFPRGGATITGPSVNLARVAAQCWGNIRYGLDIIREDEESVLICGWAWDMETNEKTSAQDNVHKLIPRKQKGGGTTWIKPDERDLRELINRRGAILKRNCLLEIMPRDLIEDAQGMCKVTLRDKITDPKGTAKKLILDFQGYSVTAEMLNEYVGHDGWDADDIVSLTGILNSLKDGEAKRDDFFGSAKAQPEDSKGLSADDMKPGDSATHQGHEDQGKPGQQTEAGF